MWLCTQSGFFSIVAHRDKKNRFLLRARFEDDLKNLVFTCSSLSPLNIEHTPNADYAFRIEITRAQLIDIMLKLATGITYPNFKGMIAKRPGQAEKLPAYEELWFLLRRMQEGEAISNFRPDGQQSRAESLAPGERTGSEFFPGRNPSGPGYPF